MAIQIAIGVVLAVGLGLGIFALVRALIERVVRALRWRSVRLQVDQEREERRPHLRSTERRP